MIRIAILDDLNDQCKELKHHIERFFADQSEIYTIDVYHNPVTFLDQFHAQYDFITLDIRMPDMDGMRLAQKIRQIDTAVIIVFITDLASWAVRGYEVEALDFMVKPIQYYDFALKMRRVMARHNQNMLKGDVLIMTRNGPVKVNQRDIYYVEVQGHDVTYHTRQQDFEYYGTLKEIESQLDSTMFSRCNSCYLVNLAHVQHVDQLSCVVNGETLRMSQTKKKNFLAKLGEFYASGGR